MLKRLLLILLLLKGVAFGQTQNEFWAKVYVSEKINPHWTIGADVQHRRQADYVRHEKNIFHYTLSNIARLWAFYKLDNNWTVVTSPLGYFYNENIDKYSGALSCSSDLRSMAGISKTYFPGKISNNNRFLYEVDLLDFNSKYSSSIRHRYRLLNSLSWPVKKINNNQSFSYNFFNEIFYKTESGSSSFDQDHIYNGFQWKIKSSAFNIGYQYTYEKSDNYFVKKNQFLLSLNVTLVKRKV